MPRSRRRAGVKTGKTVRQMELQARHDRRVAQNEAARRKAAKRVLEQRETFDKYANYPSHRPMPHPGAPT
jgi:hypothetical protein